MNHSSLTAVTNPDEPPGEFPTTGVTTAPNDLAALYDEIHAAMEAVYKSDRNYADPDAGLVAEVTSLVRQLARLGPQAVLDAGLAAMAETTVMLSLRLQAAILWHVGVIDRSGGGHRGQDALSLPQSVQALLPAMTDLGAMVIRLTEAYAKFQHILSMTENKCGSKNGRSTNGRREMAGRSPEDGSRTWAPGTPRISQSNGAGHRSILRDPIPIGG